MADQNTLAKIEGLRREILEHDLKYYLQENPSISDSEYDALIRELKDLEMLHPETVTRDSPTQRVSYGVSSSFSPATHAEPMLSLDNTYNEEEMRDWYKRVLKILSADQKVQYVIERKMDGLSCALTYDEQGYLIRAATRGDGEVGEDVTANVKTIRSIPLRLRKTDTPIPSRLEIRGEVLMGLEDFKRVNAELVKDGEDPFVNPRNCASGSLRQKDASITANRPLRFYAHSFGSWEGEKKPQTHEEFLQIARSFGLLVEPYFIAYSIEEILEYIRTFKEKTLPSLPYAVDGLVVKVNSFSQQKILGTTAKSPRWAVAFKYPASQASTIIETVEFSVGRTGVITPVAKVRPVFCAGVTISSISLHNFDEIARLKVRIGDTVLIERAGEVIPRIIKVTKHSTQSQEILPPETCPVCKTKTIKEEDQVATICPNASCPAQIRRGLLHFASRGALDIQGLGEAVVDQLVESGKVKNFADIYSLTLDDLLTLDLFAKKRAQNLVTQIEASKSKPLARLIYGLGIPHIGEKMAEILAERFSLAELASATQEDLQKIPEIGPIVATSLFGFFSSPITQSLINRLKLTGLNMSQDKPRSGKRVLEGVSFVFTGELSTMPRQKAEDQVKSLGGKTSSSVSSKTGYVVAGTEPGSKLKKAQELGVPVLSENEFLELIKKHISEQK